jgi:hypothetical protein
MRLADRPQERVSVEVVSWVRGSETHRLTCAASSVFVLKTCCGKNGLFFDLRALELRVEKTKPIKSTRATPGARAQAPPYASSAPRPAPSRTGRMSLMQPVETHKLLKILQLH